MDAIRQWTLTVCCAAVTGGIMRMILPESSVKKTFHIILSSFMVFSIILPLHSITGKNIDEIFVLSEEEMTGYAKEYAINENLLFENTACQKIKQLVESKLKEMSINNAQISVYINQSDALLQPEDIIIECLLPESCRNRHQEICQVLEYEMGTTIQIGYGQDKNFEDE